MGSTLNGMENVPYVFESIDTPTVVLFKFCGILRHTCRKARYIGTKIWVSMPSMTPLTRPASFMS